MQQFIISLMILFNSSVLNKLISKVVSKLVAILSAGDRYKLFRNDGILCFQDYKSKKLKIVSVVSVWSNCKLLLWTVLSIWKVGLSPAPPPFYRNAMVTNQLCKIENWVVFKVLVNLGLTFYPLSFTKKGVGFIFPFWGGGGSKVVVILKNTCLFTWSTKFRHSGSFQ